VEQWRGVGASFATECKSWIKREIAIKYNWSKQLFEAWNEEEGSLCSECETATAVSHPQNLKGCSFLLV